VERSIESGGLLTIFDLKTDKLSADAPHLDVEGFRAALEYTGQKTGFRMDLIEKDYFCSVVLAYLYSMETPLVFKGGTCLSKVHVGFYRLSEDLDFSIPMSIDATRSARRNAIKPVKKTLAPINKLLPGLEITGELSGHNEARQYTTEIHYSSVVTNKPGVIKFEVGLREPMVEESQWLFAKTLLLDPFKMKELLPPMRVSCLSLCEAYAEKIRAALTRKDPAIRDLFDLSHAFKSGKIDISNSELLECSKIKLSVLGTGKVNVSHDCFELLKMQIATELQPVLRLDDFNKFNFDQAKADLIRLSNEFSSLKP
jgi:predicted nucleotidyltransferase component of viral defense system